MVELSDSATSAYHFSFLFIFFLSNRNVKSEREEQEDQKAEKITELQGMEPKQFWELEAANFAARLSSRISWSVHFS